MSDTTNRILVALGLILVGVVAVWLERHGIAGVYWLSIIVVAGMCLEFLSCLWRAPRDVMFNGKNLMIFAAFAALLGLDLISVINIKHCSMYILMILAIVCMADVGAWLFGRIIGGDKLWPNISEHKTWAGQIFGIICGTLAVVAYVYAFSKSFNPRIIFVGISISLLSQYGDLTASFIKRRIGIKDFSNVLGKHGGILDRFDGWIYVLPIMWYILNGVGKCIH